MKFIRESFMGNVSTEGAELGLAHVKQITVWSNKRDSMHWWQKVWPQLRSTRGRLSVDVCL
jgi:hypothetical protein